MTQTINKSRAAGEVIAPPSKSMAHRFLICAALSENESKIENIEFSEDISATVNCLKSLGATIENMGNTLKVKGIENIKEGIVLNCNESGSTLRFLIPICLLFNKKITLIGTNRLFSRSLGVYEEIFKKENIDYSISSNSITLKGKLNGGEYIVKGDISSQFISGLMFALPKLEKDSTIKIIGKKESAPYIDLTVSALKTFGVKIENKVKNEYFIKGNQSFSARNVKVEGDYSNAAFLDAFNLIGGNVKVLDLNPDSLQGDKVYKEHFKTLQSSFAKIDLSDCPDLSMILMVLAAVKYGAEFTGTKRLKIKESNRGVALAEELKKFGVDVTVTDEKIKVEKSNIIAPKVPLNSHNDHRIVMALSVLCSLTGGIIEGAEAVNKSFPNFFEKIAKLGIKVEENVIKG